MESSKRSASQISGPSDAGTDKKVRPTRAVTWALSTGRDQKDTQPFVMHLPEEEGKMVDGELWVPASLVVKAVQDHVASLGLDDGVTKEPTEGPLVAGRDVAAVLKGDKLPLRYYLGIAEPHIQITSTKFQLWAIPLNLHKDETVANWFTTDMADIPPYKAQANFAPTLALLQPDKKDAYKRMVDTFNTNDLGRFLAVWGDLVGDDKTDMRDLTRARLVGCIWDHSPNLWDPPVRIAGAFGRTVTNSHDYVTRHHQGCVRVLLHQDMMVPEDAAQAQGLDVGERISMSDQESDESGDKDPDDMVVSAKLRTFFKGQTRWIIEGTRDHVNKFMSKYMGCNDNGLYRMVNSGYAQYLIPKTPTSFRF